MKLRFNIAIIILSIVALGCKQDTNSTNNGDTTTSTTPATASSAKEWETYGYKNYNTEHQTAIDAFLKAAAMHESANDYKSAAVMYTNVSNLYRDAMENKNAAVDYGMKALLNWRKEKDLLQQGNLLKDIGLLQAETFQFREAYRSLNEALIIFRRFNNHDAIAITEFNIASTNYIAERYDAAIQHMLLSKEHWVKKGNPNRILNINILGINIYKKNGQLEEVQKLIDECENIRSNNEVNRYAEQRYLKAIQE